MNTENQKMLSDVRNALDSDDSIFIGLVGNGNIDVNGMNFMSNSENMDLVNAILIETCLRNIFRREQLGELIEPGKEDVAEFAKDVIKSSNKIALRKLRELGKTVDNGNPVNVIKVNPKKHAAAIAIDVSNPKNLESNDFFNSMPEELKQRIRRMVGGTGE
ncbi:hypothetical protein [Companilactobacillus nantensis]|uniref:Uncharacterized protein n=1 Tax=Companilactobacillus nantensis DSM 16982 TaxID=1423774 RepID=A0A0R1WVQ6_9LACO|nr:hypothetical protein [Companilactobacillus nantensis]KRM18444.1 hypothetical protein FD31_GL000991 [Companilactobacillus nantensis DSM 16982]GEO63014.1 hypothetical protein LNA01_01970 [Companilactobacillus nantensis]